ncbi:MAG TPA: hypothetical protein VJV78_46110 [Polyangiales bacterium]|nr:hypothetical protein [Polyangiales bacterium]
MESRHLIDAIVQQTTLLIAQLSTAAGIRAPLARLADQVFLELSRELEAQGVTRKVAADMFGLALRSYQKKIQRLSESATAREQTLWEAVIAHLRQSGGASRKALLAAFKRENPDDLAAVLKDLLSSGLISAAGRGAAAFYQVSSPEAQAAIAQQSELDVIMHLVWLAVYDHQPIRQADLIARVPFGGEATERALAALIEDARIEDTGEVLRCTQLQIPVGAEQGWEAAVLDHFRAMANAIGAKLRTIGMRSSSSDRVGGSTLSFSIHAGHPYEQEVYGLLARVRTDVNSLWNLVSEHNRGHGIDDEKRVEVTFYFGQHVTAEDAGEEPT